jgi:hypothetical protein
MTIHKNRTSKMRAQGLSSGKCATLSAGGARGRVDRVGAREPGGEAGPVE